MKDGVAWEGKLLGVNSRKKGMVPEGTSLGVDSDASAVSV